MVFFFSSKIASMFGITQAMNYTEKSFFQKRKAELILCRCITWDRLPSYLPSAHLSNVSYMLQVS